MEKLFLKIQFVKCFGFNEMPRSGSHKLSAGTGGLMESEERWSSVFKTDCWKILHLGPVLTCLRFTQQALLTTLMWGLHAKCKQENKKKKCLEHIPLSWPGARSVAQAPLPCGIILSLPLIALVVLEQSQLSSFSNQFVQLHGLLC